MIFIVFALILILFGCWYAYDISFFSPKYRRPGPDIPLDDPQYESVAEHICHITQVMEKYPFEKVVITSFDGTKLFGRYYHLRDGAPVKLLVHGYRSHPFRDCSGGHALSRKMGFNALVVDQRGLGASGGHTITFGIKERKDCLCWIRYLTERFGAGTPIILSGLSMGAATVLMATSLNLPDNVACIIADSPYSSPAAIIEKVCADKHYPVPVCRPFLHLGALLFGGFRLGANTAKEAVKHSKIPILLIHGEADHFVPCQMSLEIAAACASAVEVATFPGAGHGLSYLTDPLRYEAVVCHFLRSVPAIRDTINPEFIKELERNMNN